MRIKLLFKKSETLSDDMQALIDVSISLGLRMDKISTYFDTGHVGNMDRLAA